MKIGILSQNKEINISGINRVTKGIMTELLDIDKTNEYSFIGEAPWLGIPLNSLPIIFNNRTAIDLNYALCPQKMDIVHSHYRAFSLSKGIPCAKILTIHDLIPLIYQDWYSSQVGYFNEVIRKCAMNVDRIITVSDHTKKDVMDLYGIPEEKISVVYNGLYPENIFAPGIDGIPVDGLEKSRFLLSVSGVGPHKNQVGLAEAFVRYKKLHPQDDLKLVLTGPIRRYQVIRDIFDKFPQEAKSIILTGFVTDEQLLWLYQNSVAFIYVSFYEGFGLPILEAMSIGKAVISSNTSSMPEVGGEAVEYCTPTDIESIVSSIEKVVTSETYKNQLESKAIVQSKKFSYKRAARELLDIYAAFEE